MPAVSPRWESARCHVTIGRQRTIRTAGTAGPPPNRQADMTTPARRQYLEIKSQYPDAILLSQIGDFFEAFDEAAHIAARELQIVLTARSYGPGERVPLAGVPVHALDTYAARLVARGRKVAICEQVSPPGRGLVRREVTRVLTPGTVVEPGMVPLACDNYLAAVAFAPAKGGTPAGGALAYVDAPRRALGCRERADGPYA